MYIIAEVFLSEVLRVLLDAGKPNLIKMLQLVS